MYPRALIFRTPSGEYKPATTPVAFFILELLGGVIAAFVFTIMHAQGYGSSISGTSKYDAEFVGTFVLVVTVGADPLRLADSRFAGQESLLPPFACVGNLRVVHTSRVGVGFRLCSSFDNFSDKQRNLEGPLQRAEWGPATTGKLCWTTANNHLP